jgi:restriction system protein
MKNLPQRAELFSPVIKALFELGGSGTTEEIRDKVIANLKIPDELANIPHASKREGAESRTQLEYNLAWARTYMKQLGYVDNSRRGVWSLTKKGIEEGVNVKIGGAGEAAIEPEMATQWRAHLLKILSEKLSPGAFERLIQRILRETGFAQVEVTGRSGDGGIDGKGVARINGILSFRVVFQCKRYKGSVGASEIRDFQGAMMGRADKGLFITTGFFTRDAIKEATRDGATAIDLVDGERLVEKLRELALGVKIESVERITVDASWFDGI